MPALQSPTVFFACLAYKFEEWGVLSRFFTTYTWPVEMPGDPEESETDGRPPAQSAAVCARSQAAPTTGRYVRDIELSGAAT